MNPYLSIWFNTTKTIDAVILNKVKFNFVLPILLAGVSSAIGSQSVIFNLDNLIESIASSLIIIFLTFLAATYFFPWAIRMTGKIWKGNASFKQLQTIFGLSQIPVILVLSLQLLNLIIGVSKVQKFSYGLAIVNLVVMISPFILLRLIIGN